MRHLVKRRNDVLHLFPLVVIELAITLALQLADCVSLDDVGRLKIKATALGISKVTGKIKVKVHGKVYKVKLKKGRAFIRLDRFAKAGKKKIVVAYKGNRKIRGTREVIRIRVKRT